VEIAPCPADVFPDLLTQHFHRRKFHFVSNPVKKVNLDLSFSIDLDDRRRHLQRVLDVDLGLRDGLWEGLNPVRVTASGCEINNLASFRFNWKQLNSFY